MNRNWKKSGLIFFLLLTAALLLCACQAKLDVEAAPVAEAESPDLEATDPGGTSMPPERPKDPETIQVVFAQSPHQDTYVEGNDGKNSSCARCHSPANWTPSMEDMPESCYACKFEIKPPPPVVEKSEWQNLECRVCHRVNKSNVEPEYVWLEIPPIEEYAEVGSPSDLCYKCHTVVDVEGHNGTEVEGAHTGMECTDCHDAHETTASCNTPGCHKSIDEGTTPPGHDDDHVLVQCGACHDATRMDVGPGDEGEWTTFAESGNARTSHNTVLEAPCDRCHFPGNSWGLSEGVEQ